MVPVGRWGQRLLSTSLSDASWTASGSEHPHQSVMSSDHLLAGRPRGRSPFTIPSIIIFTSLWSFIQQMCPNSCNFFCFTTLTIVQCLRTLSLTMLLLTLSFQHTLSIFYNISYRMPGVFWSMRLLLSTSRQHRADEKIHTPPADLGWSYDLFQHLVLMVNSLQLQNVFSIPSLWLARLILRFISALQSLSFVTRLPSNVDKFWYTLKYACVKCNGWVTI